AAGILLHLRGVFGNHLVDQGLDGAFVGDLLQTLFLDDGRSVLTALPHCLEYFLGEARGDGAVSAKVTQSAELLRAVRSLCRADARGVERAEVVECRPIRGELGVALATVKYRLGEGRIGVLGDENACVISAEPIVFHEATLF